MGQPEKVSVIIPSYNYAHYLEECLESVRAQSYSNWEAVIVDDGSTDATEQVAGKLVELDPGRIHYHRITNSGVAAARNTAIERSTGEYLLPLDADDLLVPDAIEEFLQALKSNPQAGFSYSALENYGALPGIAAHWFPGPYSKKWISQENLAACTGMWRRDQWQAGVRFRELIHEDWDLWLQIVKRGQGGVYIPKPLLRYRQHPGGRHSLNKHLYYLAFMEIAQNNPELYAPAVVESAKRSLKNVPDCLSKPSIALVPSEATPVHSLAPIAQGLISQGYFVALIGKFSEGVIVEDGLALIQLVGEGGAAEISSRCGMLGPNLIILTDRPEHERRHLRACSNVRVVSDFESSEAELLTQFETDRAEFEEREAGFQGALKQLAESPSLGQTEVAKLQELLTVVIPVRDPKPDLLIPSLRALKDSFCGNQVRVRVVCRAKHESELGGVVEGFNVQVLTIPDDNLWNLGYALNVGLRDTGTPWFCAIQPAVMVHGDFWGDWLRYLNALPEPALYFAQASRLPVSQEVQNRDRNSDFDRLSQQSYSSHEVHAHCAIFPTQWLQEQRGFSEQLFESDHIEQELSYRASLTGLRSAWLPSGLLFKQWEITTLAREWSELAARTLEQWKNSEHEYFNSEQWGVASEKSLQDLSELPDQQSIEVCFQEAVGIEQQLRGTTAQVSDIVQLLFAWGNHSLQMGQHLSALDAFEDMLCLQGDSVDALNGLARVYLARNNVQLSGHYACEALRHDATNDLAKQVLVEIQRILGEG